MNAHGLYNTEQFVLRLSPRNHQVLNQLTSGELNPSRVSGDTLQAYSTYLHETVHWWQHVGSTIGVVLSLCYPNQTHSNVECIRDWCGEGAPEKSIKKSALQGELAGNTHLDRRQALANTIVNNCMDFEFFRQWILQPERSVEIYEDPYFESQGHAFHVAYSTVSSHAFHIVGSDLSFAHDTRRWASEFERLSREKVVGYFYGSPIVRRRVGLVEIFEGQACFSQMQFLASVSDTVTELDDFRRAGMLHGVYETAFVEFLRLAELDPPANPLDPTVGLFLLICDLSINPVDGFPCDIRDFPGFVVNNDPGIRFELLCRAVSSIGSPVSSAVNDYSAQEYMDISTLLVDEVALRHPSEAWREIERWKDESPGVASLMEEHSRLDFAQENIVYRVLLSHFIAFTLDKARCPHFFCWPGYWKASSDKPQEFEFLWLKHLSLFSDKEDDDGVFIRQFPGINANSLTETLNLFFAHNVFFDLSRQWVLHDGKFNFDFRWLSSKHDEMVWRDWADGLFKKQYGVSIFEIVQA